MLRLPPPSPLNGMVLTAALAAQGMVTSVYLADDELVLGDLSEAQRSAATTVVDAHGPIAAGLQATAAEERANETTIRERADSALATNTTFLDIASPTNAQLAAQVKALTRQNNGLIRLVLRRFDATD